MDSLDKFTKLLGWCSIINIAIYAVSAIILMIMRGPLSELHTMMFGLAEGDATRAYFQFIVQYKMAIIFFNLVPYVAFRIIGRPKMS